VSFKNKPEHKCFGFIVVNGHQERQKTSFRIMIYARNYIKAILRISHISFLCISICIFSAGIQYVCAQDIQFQFIRAIGKSGLYQGEFIKPQGIAVDISGRIYVADTGNNRIQLLLQDSSVYKVYGGFGKDISQFDGPVSVWAGDGLYVCIADKNNHRIVILDRVLNYISQIDGRSSADQSLNFRYPMSAARSSSGELFILDSENKRVIRYNAGGIPINSFGGNSSAGPPLRLPIKLVLFETQMIYISDGAQRAVIAYDYFGNYRGLIGQKILQTPAGLTVSDKGDIILCDSSRRQVIIFNPSGRILGTLMYTTITNPVDVAFYNNALYVLNNGENTILIFKMIYNKF